MSDPVAPRFRKTKTEKWAVMAPVETLEKALAGDGVVEVQRRDGNWSTFTVASLGKPFDVDGVQMCYGYGPDDGDEESGSDAGSDTGSGRSDDRSGEGGGRRGGSVGRRPRPARSGTTGADARSSSGRARPQAGSGQAPPRDPSEPLPEFKGGPEDEWDGF